METVKEEAEAAAYQVRTFLLNFSEFWVYPTLAVLFILTVRFPRRPGIGVKILWDILLFVCRMSAAWAFQMTAYTTTQMAFRTVWYAVLIYFGFWFLKAFNNYSYSTQE